MFSIVYFVVYSLFKLCPIVYSLNSVFTCFKPVVVNSVRCMFCFMFANGSSCCFWAYFVDFFWGFCGFLFFFAFLFLKFFHSHWLFCIVVFLLQYSCTGQFLHSLVQCVILVLFLYWYSLFFSIVVDQLGGRYRSSFSWS